MSGVPSKVCNRPGATHPERAARFHLVVRSRTPGKFGVDCVLCAACARDFRQQFTALLTFGLADLEPI